LVIGKSELVREGRTALAILVFGPILHTAIVVAEKLDATVVDMRFVKPLDVAMVRKLEESNSVLVTIEDGVVMGGAGSAVCEALGNVNSKVLRIGLPDKFVAHGDTNLLFQECCLDEQGILEQINDFMRKAD
jgi:1-deoxy-D-xylulose-5-phosphate synthase